MNRSLVFGRSACAWLGAGMLALHGLDGRAAEPDIRRDAVVEVVEHVMPSVVNIGTKTRVQQRGMFYDWWRDNWAPYTQELPPRESAGSGVIIDESGWVVTNVHVVEEASEIWVSVEGKIYRATLEGGSARKDVALLRLQAKPGERFKAARFAADDDLLLGETVLALGNPFGLGGSVARGILSSKSRRASAEGADSLDIPDWLQTDAAINPGNSGGPLVNLRGEVIGINVAVLKAGQGIGFAIPIKRVSEALSESFTPEALTGYWFGARVKAGGRPLTVTQVQPGSPADKAGLRPGDAVLTVNEQPVRGFIEFSRLLINNASKRALNLQIRRAGETRLVSVRCVPESQFFNAELIRQKTGVTIEELGNDEARKLRAAGVQGLVVAEVEKGSPAALARLQAGCVIQAINGEAVTDVTAAAKLLYEKKKGESLELAVLVPWQRGARIGFHQAAAELKLR